ncbi:beta-ketoacyl-ACP synthase II [Alphaproteobacteria bacterium]|jgi:3-oxoacyl-[acyl-carrier-protein] synthase II|nr:beta-ketoacyl-ACP synthase II [Alphaproteobacteria bacterium]MDB3916172.1 beta-ketoacyl-ACP synthase II [Alphaproteobacteria bacterium]
MRRVVVTGMGLTTPLGNGIDVNWKRLTSGVVGINKIENFDVSDLPCKIAGQVPNINNDPEGGLDIDNWIEPREYKRIDRFISYGIISAVQAVEHSGWKPKSENEKNRTGVILGSGIGGLETIANTTRLLDTKGPRKISPFFIPSALINLLSGQVSIRYGFKGPNHSVVTACSTGAHAIGDASRIIRYGDADVMIAGGAEAACCRIGMAGFAAARALSTNFNDQPSSSSRPWDQERDGFVMGEGAGVLVLEEREHAIARGANIYAEIKGYGMSGDAHHITAPAENGDGGFRAMRSALSDANINNSEIDYINAHGTSTPLGDMIELKAIGRLLGDNVSKVSISSTKSATGHLLGAAGAIEAIFSILSIVNQIVPPTNNLINPDEQSVGFDLVPINAKERTIRNVLSNSFGFGGTNASLLLGSVD